MKENAKIIKNVELEKCSIFKIALLFPDHGKMI